MPLLSTEEWGGEFIACIIDRSKVNRSETLPTPKKKRKDMMQDDFCVLQSQTNICIQVEECFSTNPLKT